VRVSVVLAAHNEAQTIAAIVRGCAAATPDLLEVIVVDDGSTDGTRRLAAEAGARVVRLETNQGKGCALRRGIADAAGDVLVFLDADGQDDPAEIPVLLRGLDDGVDMVIGSRFLGRFGPGAITGVNRAGNRMLTAILNALFGVRLTDTQAGYRALRRSVLERCRLTARRYDIEVDLVLGVLRAGGRIAEVPVSRAARAGGTTDLDSLRDGSRILWRIVRLRFT